MSERNEKDYFELYQLILIKRAVRQGVLISRREEKVLLLSTIKEIKQEKIVAAKLTDSKI